MPIILAMETKTMKKVLFLIPFVGILVGGPAVNGIHMLVLDMPFIMFWLFLWFFLTPIITYQIYRMDEKEKAVVK